MCHKLSETEILVANFKKRLSGVTSTIINLVPCQSKLGAKIAAIGVGLPAGFPRISFGEWSSMWLPPVGRTHRVWHSRRNFEMLFAILCRDVLRMPLKLVFTSASQRQHSGWTQYLIGQMDRVIATSHQGAAYLCVPSQVIMHGIDTEKFFPDEQGKSHAKEKLGWNDSHQHIVCVGRIRAQKGTDLFVESMLELLPRFPDWMSYIVGRTTAQYVEFQKALEDKIAQAGLSERIRFVGEVGYQTNTGSEEIQKAEHISDVYRASDLYVAPQRWEGFGLTPLESMACGTPVIATNVGAFEDLIVPMQTGEIIERAQLGKMVSACERWMADEDLRRSASVKGVEHVRSHFSLKTEAEALIAVYDELLNKK